MRPAILSDVKPGDLFTFEMFGRPGLHLCLASESYFSEAPYASAPNARHVWTIVESRVFNFWYAAAAEVLLWT